MQMFTLLRSPVWCSKCLCHLFNKLHDMSKLKLIKFWFCWQTPAVLSSCRVQ